MNKFLHRSVALALLSSGTVITTGIFFSHNALASGYSIIENSGSGMGQAFAGVAAVAEDPSTVFFNPAGMTYLDGTQLTAGLHIIDSNARFKDQGSTPISGNNGGNAGDIFFVPNLYYVQEFGDNYRFGLGINAPYGLGTDYGNSWKGRYTSTNSELKSININPSIAFKANDRLSIGLGINIQYLEATLESNIYQAALGQTDGQAKITGDSTKFGYNMGLIYELIPATTRLGIHYRSEISHSLEGNAKFTNMHPLLGGNRNVNVYADITTPSTLSISLTHQVNDQLTLLADVTHTQWNNFQELTIISDDNNGVISSVDENWDNSYRVSLGLKYQMNHALTLRTGIAHDQTPIKDSHRTSRIPGDDRNWLSFGASYNVSSNFTLDMGYSHLWVEDAKINEDYPLLTSAGTLKGKFNSDVDILSFQGTWKF